MLSRRLVMDAQRFDISQRGRVRPCLRIETGRATTKHESAIDVKSLDVPPKFPASIVGSVWDVHAGVEFPVELSRSPSSSDEDISSSSFLSFSPPSSSVTFPSTVALDDDTNPHEMRKIDIIDKGIFTTTRTIICPTPRSPVIFSCPNPSSLFSRSSSPIIKSRPSSPTRPGSPMNISLNSLSCFSLTNAFEVDINAMLEREAVAQPAIEVVVTQENGTHAEELCEVLYSTEIPSGIRRRRGCPAPSYAFGIS